MTDNTNAPTEGAINDSANQAPAQDDPILKKNRELLAETKAERDKRRELEARLADFEQKEAIKAEEDALKRGEFDKVKADYEKRLADFQGKYETRVISESLTGALKEINVAAPFFDAAKALFKDKGLSLDKDENVLIGNMPLSEAIKEWANSDSGKAFIAAPLSTGGGATGGGAAQSKTIKRSAFDALSQGERAQVAKDGIKVVD